MLSASGEIHGDYDIIVIGAGSAGCVVANAVSTEPSTRVALIEAGTSYRSAQTPPAIRAANFGMALSGHYHWTDLTAQPNDQQQPRNYLQGKGVGGSSAINAQGGTRPHPGDIDAWEHLGATGWNFTRLLPSLRAIETDHDFGEADYHGTTGPLPITRIPHTQWGPVSTALAQAALNAGHHEHPDQNAPDAGPGLSPAAFTRNDQGRVSANDSFLDPALERPNLTLLPNTQALRLRLAGDHITGCWVSVQGAAPQLLRAPTIYLCAGAIHTPTLLLRSGIGPEPVLRHAGIPLVHHLPGVGARLGEHPMLWLTFPRSGPGPAADALPGHCALTLTSGTTRHDGDLEIYPLDATPIGPDIAGLMVSLLAPESRGTLTLQSDGTPHVALNLLAADTDLTAMHVAAEQALDLLASNAMRQVTAGPAMLNGQPLTGLSRADLSQLMRSSVQEYYHASGTCPIGNDSDSGAVLDPRGAVHGITGLHIADSSALPGLPRSATHLATTALAHCLTQQAASSTPPP